MTQIGGFPLNRTALGEHSEAIRREFILSA